MISIYNFGMEQVDIEIRNRHRQTAKSYRTVLCHLKNFMGESDRCFQDITEGTLKDFELYLQGRQCCRNSISLYMRHLMALHNRAAGAGITTPPGDLYRKSVFTGYEETRKRTIDRRTLARIRDAELTGVYRRFTFTQDLFMLSFYLRGIPFIDLAHLRSSDLKEGVLTYRRSKTGKLVKIVPEACALEIFNRYKDMQKDSPYLLPIIKNPEQKEDQRQYDNALRLYNKHLGRLTEILRLDVKLTSYTPRHTWANVAHDEGIDIPHISEALGHSSEKTTRHYIESFTPDALVEINRRVIASIGPKTREKKEKRKRNREKTGSIFRSGSPKEPERMELQSNG